MKILIKFPYSCAHVRAVRCYEWLVILDWAKLRTPISPGMHIIFTFSTYCILHVRRERARIKEIREQE